MSVSKDDEKKQDDQDVDPKLLEIQKLVALSKSFSSVDPSAISVSTLAGIEKLDLFDADLTSLPESLPKYLPNLSILFCMKNKFSQVPEVIGKCPKLQMVSFKSNEITSIHPEALQPQLRWLILTDNKITSIPSTIGRCTKLQKFMMSGNCLSSIPKEIENCHSLELIRLASNQLSTPPMELLSLPKLSWCAFSGNPFIHQGEDMSSVDEMYLQLFSEPKLDDPTQGTVLGKGASGVTRKYELQIEKNGKSEEIPVAVKEYYSSMTSDGSPQDERKVAMIASSLGCKSLVHVLGKTSKGNLIMELLKNYSVLAEPPSLESCSRDVYEDGLKISEARARAIIGDLLYALMKLHEKGICHGDFYGHNILISDDTQDQIWLTDFGAAFLYDGQSDFGKLIVQIEKRAFLHLVNEVNSLVPETLQELKEKISQFSMTIPLKSFDELHRQWKEV